MRRGAGHSPRPDREESSTHLPDLAGSLIRDRVGWARWYISFSALESFLRLIPEDEHTGQQVKALGERLTFFALPAVPQPVSGEQVSIPPTRLSARQVYLLAVSPCAMEEISLSRFAKALKVTRAVLDRESRHPTSAHGKPVSNSPSENDGRACYDTAS